jgi:hypothetical protein
MNASGTGESCLDTGKGQRYDILILCFRIIIDEAQCIKNKATLNAQAACELQSLYRFCMTGTPMMNTIDDLYSLIHFLRIRPYNDQQQFNVVGWPL